MDIYTNSEWLKSIGFDETASKDYTLCGWLVLKCNQGQWQAYSVKSSHWHFLCAVDLRSEVLALVSGLKLMQSDACDRTSDLVAKLTILADRLGGEAGQEIRKVLGV